MTKKLLWGLLIATLIILLLIPSCTTTTSTQTTTTKVTTQTTASSTTSAPATTAATTAKANWWDPLGTPKYGGEIRLRISDTSDLTFDTFGNPWTGGHGVLCYDTLFISDWAVDRSVWSSKVAFLPSEYVTGSMAESWEITDSHTIVVKIKKGIHFQNKAPVNGREIVADDILWHYNRLCGFGPFTMASPYFNTFTDTIESITKIDNYSVAFKFKDPGATVTILSNLLNGGGKSHYIEAHEVYDIGEPVVLMGGEDEAPAEGPPGEGPPGAGPTTGPTGLNTAMNDWKYAIGTGPWILQDFIAGNSLTYVKNPDYFGTDERFPKNKLPYADKLVDVVIGDFSTALAALRTGKVDIVTKVDWRQAKTLKESNPELQQGDLPTTGSSLMMNLNNAPYSDIRVRKALDMAIDRESIAKNYYGGLVEGKPTGQVSPLLTGYAYPYDQWPAETRAEYTYDVAGAKALLAEAGYPSGFKTTLTCANIGDQQLMQILKAMFLDIGIDMTIDAMDVGRLIPIVLSAKHEIAESGTELGSTGAPWNALKQKTPFFFNPSTVNDETFNNMVLDIDKTTDIEQIKKKCADADLYLIQHHWHIAVIPVVTFNVWSASLGGYSGETLDMGAGAESYYARWWKK